MSGDTERTEPPASTAPRVEEGADMQREGTASSHPPRRGQKQSSRGGFIGNMLATVLDRGSNRKSRRGLGRVTTQKNLSAGILFKASPVASLTDVARRRGRSEATGLTSAAEDADRPEGPDRGGEHRYIVSPDGRFRRNWDLFQLLVLIYICIAVPLRVGFDRPAYGGWFIFDLIVDLLFMSDVALNFFTAYETETGDLQTHPRSIAAHYACSWLALDFVSAFPVDYIVRGADGTLACSFSHCGAAVASTSKSQPRLFKLFRILRVTRLFKLLRLARVNRLLEKYQASLFMLLPAIGIIRQITVLAFVGHLLGCFFYYFSTSSWQTSEERALVSSGMLSNWIETDYFGEEFDVLPGADGSCPTAYEYDSSTQLCHTVFSLGVRYVGALYWAFTTMTTVGYRDISANTLSERIYNIFALIVGAFVFSGIISRMGSIVSSFDAATKAQTERMETVKVFLRDVKMPAELRAPVLSFFKKQRVKSYDTREVLALLPFELRSRVVKHMYESDIKNAPVLGFRRDDIFTTDLCMRIQMYSVSAYTYVYQRGETSTDISILLRGELVFVDVDRDSIVAQMCKGAMFGISSAIEVIQGTNYRPRRRENVSSLSGCDMLKITLEDFLEIVITYPDVLPPFQKYYEELVDITTTAKSHVLTEAISKWRTMGGHGEQPPVTAAVRRDAAAGGRAEAVQEAQRLGAEMLDARRDAAAAHIAKSVSAKWRQRQAAKAQGSRNAILPVARESDRSIQQAVKLAEELRTSAQRKDVDQAGNSLRAPSVGTAATAGPSRLQADARPASMGKLDEREGARGGGDAGGSGDGEGSPRQRAADWDGHLSNISRRIDRKSMDSIASRMGRSGAELVDDLRRSLKEEGSSHQHQAPAALAAGMRVPSAQEQALGSNAERRSRLGDERLKSTASIDVLQGMSPLGDRAGD